VRKHSRLAIRPFAGKQHPRVVFKQALKGETKIVEGTASKSLPQLDRFYVAKTPNPTIWDHYHNELADDAEQLLLHWLRGDSP
jgi:hypothetical protein